MRITRDLLLFENRSNAHPPQVDRPIVQGVLSLIVILSGFIYIYHHIVSLMLADDKKIEEHVKRQYFRTIEVKPERGNIFDRKGNKLATNTFLTSIAIDPSKLRDDQKVPFASNIHSLVGIPLTTLIAYLYKSREFLYLKRLADDRLVERVKSLNFGPSLDAKEKEKVFIYQEEPKRYYPNGGLLGQVLGYTNIDGVGMSGLEKYYDTYLKGKETQYLRVKGPGGKDLDVRDALLKKQRPGDDIILTIDRNIQMIVEDEISKIGEKFHPNFAFSIVMNPSTGEILAMSNYPFFDPNYERSPILERNHSIMSQIEPGSTFKVFLTAIALERGVVNPEELFDCEGGIFFVGRKPIKDTKPHDLLTVTEIIKYSSNIGAIKIGRKLGKPLYYEGILAFGFGEKTGIDLPYECDGRILHPERWRPIDFATHTYGQGLVVTGIQLCRAFCALINGGKLMKPYIVREIRDKEGRVVLRRRPEVERQVISKETSEKMKKIMKTVLEKGGTGEKLALNGYSAGGKTGTAQKLVNGRYSGKNWTSSFVGFSPYRKPELAIVVVVDDPKGGYYGASVAGPVFKGVSEKVLSYLGEGKEIRRKDLKKISDAGDFMGEREEESSYEGRDRDGSSRGITPPHSIPSVDSGRVHTYRREPLNLVTIADGYIIPDWTGRSMREIIRILKDKNLKFTFKGTGYAISQSPEKGSLLKAGGEIQIEFSRDSRYVE